MKNGFTLVELSIVLVIIGLLIGGILVAQSMVSSAKVLGYVKSLQQFQVAVQNFKTTYKKEPGDNPFFMPAGNDDGLATNAEPCINATGYTAGGIYSGNETEQSWAHLSQAGMIKGDFAAYEPQFCGGAHTLSPDDLVGITSPVWLESAYGYAATPKQKISYDITNAPKFNFPMEPLDTIIVDRKIDDGESLSGDMISRNSSYDRCDDHIKNGGTLNTLCWNAWYPEGGAPNHF